MISVPNRPLLLSGSKWFLFSGILLLIIAACSPKVVPVAVQPKKVPEKPIVSSPPVVKKPVEPKVSTISLLLPFGLDHLQPGSSYTTVSLREADIALDYYKGFKLALDSLSGQGYNYKLLVFDTKGDKAQSHSLATNPAVRTSDLIIGPVFPDDLKEFTGIYANQRQPIVSPLSAASPATFKSQELITAIPPLEYHALSAATYINNRIKPKKIFILKSGFSEENDYIIPFKKAIDSLSNKQIKVIAITVVHGQLNSLVPQLSVTGQNVFIVPATNQRFLTVTLNTLDSLAQSYPVTLFGHPSWKKFQFLKADLLQRLNTHITSTDQVDYKATNTVTFMRSYRAAYNTEATGYAIKGFDEGLYLGQLLATDNLKNITQTNFSGLDNSFRFQKIAGLGWVNTHVDIFKYANFDLKKVE
ncbi:MAG TPA: ABC transporter substrate-binding protein [Mucilaginibacter sp.]|jgi:ABC-type branched-subunit amino acid transport system substrate-binding protein